MLDITKIKIRKIFNDDSNLKALVSVTLFDAITIHEIKVVQGNSRLFAAMPSRMDEGGNYRDIIHPINAETREQIENAVLLAYESFIEASEKGGFSL